MKRMVVFVPVGRRGRIVLPQAVRVALGVDEGDRLAFIVQKGEAKLVSVKMTLLDLRGSVPVKDTQDFDAIRAQMRDRHAAEVVQNHA